MFTGIIESVGTIEVLNLGRITILTDFEDISVGESIAANGVCLTVTSTTNGMWTADISEETASRTTFPHLKAGSLVNLERSMLATGRFGGHIVAGHVDGTASVMQRLERDDSSEVWFDADRPILRYLVPKGSVAIDGVSLTVAELEPQAFSVALVPHTLRTTNLKLLRVGHAVNIEVDLLAKYIERLITEVHR